MILSNDLNTGSNLNALIALYDIEKTSLLILIAFAQLPLLAATEVTKAGHLWLF